MKIKFPILISSVALASMLFFTACDKADDTNHEDKTEEPTNDDDDDNDDNFIISTTHNGVFDGEYGSTGEMTINCNYTTENLQISQIVVRYEIGSFFGEPTWKSVIKWEGTGNISQLKWAAQVLDADDQPVQHNGQTVYCHIRGGVLPKPGEGYGDDVTGSPNWKKTFKYYNSESKELTDEISAEDAKTIYKADFVLGNIMILEINDVKL